MLVSRRGPQRGRRFLVQSIPERAAPGGDLPLEAVGIDAFGDDVQPVGDPAPDPIAHQRLVMPDRGAQSFAYVRGMAGSRPRGSLPLVVRVQLPGELQSRQRMALRAHQREDHHALHGAQLHPPVVPAQNRRVAEDSQVEHDPSQNYKADPPTGTK